MPKQATRRSKPRASMSLALETPPSLISLFLQVTAAKSASSFTDGSISVQSESRKNSKIRSDACREGTMWVALPNALLPWRKKRPMHSSTSLAGFGAPFKAAGTSSRSLATSERCEMMYLRRPRLRIIPQRNPSSDTDVCAGIGSECRSADSGLDVSKVLEARAW